MYASTILVFGLVRECAPRFFVVSLFLDSQLKFWNPSRFRWNTCMKELRVLILYEQVPVTGETFWLRNFAPWFLRVETKLALFFMTVMWKKTLRTSLFIVCFFVLVLVRRNFTKFGGCSATSTSTDARKTRAVPVFYTLSWRRTLPNSQLSFLTFIFPTRRPPTQCHTPAHTHPRVESCTTWLSSFLNPSQPLSFHFNCTLTQTWLHSPPSPLVSMRPTIQYLSTNSTFPSFNLPRAKMFSCVKKYAGVFTVCI